jgi:hypothetical protein
MTMSELQYEGQMHKKVAERLFEINNNRKLFDKETKKFSMHEMARKIIPQNLKPQARFTYIKQGGKELHDKEEIIALCQHITGVLRTEYGIQQLKRARPCNNNSSRGSLRKQN